jgi:GWxTD domain-containing protein
MTHVSNHRQPTGKRTGTFVRSIAVICLLYVCMLPIAGEGAPEENFDGERELLKRLEPEERYIYYGTQYLMNPHQALQYLTLPTRDEREEWLARFWIDLDPTPTSPENERKIEHEKRVALARKLFSMKKVPGWDKRGETLIRFGMPSSRERVFADISFYRFIPPSELWYYESLDMLVHLQDFNLKGEFIYAIEPYGRSAREEQDRWATLNTLMEHGLFQDLYAYEYMDLDEMKDIVAYNPDDIDYVADVDLRMETPKDLISQFEQEKVERSANNFYKYMKEHPLVYSFEIGTDLLDLFFDISIFKMEGGDSLRTEISFEIPTSDVRFVRTEGMLQAEILLEAVVRNLDFEEVASGSDVISAVRSGTDGSGVPSHIPGQIVLELEPGYYRMGIEATDANSQKRGMAKTNLELVPYTGGLALSDIQFASSIGEAQPGGKFVKGNLRVVPHPLHAYRIPYPLTFYFEIYGLETDREGFSFYAIDYRITPLLKKRRGPVLEEITSVVSSKFESTATGPDQVQRLEIATENLWEGSFELTVTVTDRRTRENVSKSARFSVLE